MLLPDPRRRGEIKFVFAKSMPYNTRLALMGLLVISGFALQILLNWVFPGAVLLLAASCLAIVKGYTNIPAKFGTKNEWREGSKEQLEKIIEISRKTKKWDQSAIDISCATGFFSLLAVIFVTGGIGIMLFKNGFVRPAVALWLDTAVMFLPHWVTGVRTILTNAPLTIKVQNLLQVYSIWNTNKLEGETMAVQIEVLKGEKEEMPVDAKLILQIPSLGESFFGVQTQVVLNSVQGTDFPYLYCVLVAKTEMGMKKKLSSKSNAKNLPEAKGFLSFLIKSPGICTEWKHDDGMDILVIRQQTTQQTGYHTDLPAIQRIFKFACDCARSLKE